VAQSFGIEPPHSAAARITLVPAGTVTSRPSMVSVHSVSLRHFGRAEIGLPFPSAISPACSAKSARSAGVLMLAGFAGAFTARAPMESAKAQHRMAPFCGQDASIAAQTRSPATARPRAGRRQIGGGWRKQPRAGLPAEPTESTPQVSTAS
jgi:hypothetical protein